MMINSPDSRSRNDVAVSAVCSRVGGARWLPVTLATSIYNRQLNSLGPCRRLWSVARRILIELFQDPTCILKIHDKYLHLPLSSNLPMYLRNFPFYDRLPVRLSEYIREHWGYFKCIDVGANIGSSIAACLTHDTDFCLAIEPNPEFYRYLHVNFARHRNVRILTFICSASSKTARYHIEENHGTASIHSAKTGRVMETKTIDEILIENIDFSDFNFLKIDTDGHDFAVIAGAKNAIADNLPVVMFECAPFGNDRYVEDCLEALNLFKEVGYNSFLVYDNFGYLMGRHFLNHVSAFKHMLVYQLTSPFYYFDLLLMEETTVSTFLKKECCHFINSMSDKALQRTTMEAAGVSG